jgi:predicted ATPase
MRMVGRQTAVEAIAAQLARRRFVTIVGPGGIGKTTVAVAVGHAIAGEYGGACFVDLGPLADPRLIPSLLATALGLIVQSDNPTRDLIDFLRDKRRLLILDGCEHVIETAARLVESIFDQADGVDVLATSREALRIEGEQVYYLAPLECPPVSDTLTAAESLAFPAAQLFSDRVVATSDRFVLQDGDAPVVARICRKLDGIALAIELAAGRVNAHGIEGVEALLDSKLSLLWQGRRTAPPRHHTLNAALEWSYELLMLGAPDASLVQGLRFISVICLLISSWHFGFHGTPTLRAFRSVVGPRGPPPDPDGLIMLHLLGLPADALLRDRRRPVLLIGSAVPWAGGST